MKNTRWSNLALIGLATLASSAFAAHSINGQVRLDAQFPTTKLVSGADQSPQNHYFGLSRARLDFSGEIAPQWGYFVRLDAPAAQMGVSIESHPALDTSVSQAYATWSGMDNMHLHIGKTPGPFFSADEYAYKPYIGSDNDDNGAIGVIFQRNGDNPGVSVDGTMGMVGYSLGAWKGSNEPKFVLDGSSVESEADTHSLRFGYGARVALSPMNAAGSAVGIGLGFAQRPVNEVIEGVIGFNNQQDFTVDACGVFGALQMNAAYFYEKVGGMVADTNDSEITDTGFAVDGKSTGYYGEVGYLLIGDGYRYDASKGVIAGVNLHEGQGGLELVVRAGVERYENISAYNMRETNLNDEAKTAGTQYRVEDTSWSVHANYYMNANTILKAQYESTNHKVDDFSGSLKTSATATDPKKTTELRLRAQYSF